MEDEPETWTPQYTPPPEEECRPRSWDDRGMLSDSKRTAAKDGDDDDDDGTSRMFVPTGASLTDGGGFGDDRGDDIGAGLWGWNGGNGASAAPESDYNRGWDNSNNDNGGWDTAWKNVDTTAASSDAGVINGWSAVDSSGMNDREVFHANSGAAAADAFSPTSRDRSTRAPTRGCST